MGAIFGTLQRGAGICEACAGPASAALCDTCAGHRRTFGVERLADHVVPLSYAVKGQQSGHHMHGYKGDRGSSADNLRDVKFLARGAAFLHRNCIIATVGRPWAAVTFVCSATRPGTQHPVSLLGDQVVIYDDPSVLKFQIKTGPSIEVDRRDGPLPDRFVIPDRWTDRVHGKHVLVVDDTWVAGRNSQSVSIALKDAGASEVTVVCVARWLDRYYDGHGALIDSLPDLFDPLLCPVTGGACPS
ncbi:hypothetical protein AD006_31585 (plasmid) [Pseudonocardia sp. EC080610-09]|nr:hypothetical protein AD006_31585 [Pseudonocardia sp. EC080610-09]ALL85349.1 hypothetical protein AD017_29665 [Pseudonocardia sp. EC080619-01]